MAGVAATVRPILAGETVTRWEDPTGEEHDVTVQVAASGRTSVPNLAALPLATSRRNAAGAAVMVPLGDVAKITLATAPAQLDRKNLQRVVPVSAGVTPALSISEASTLIRDKLALIPLPAGYQVVLGGETEQLEETGGYVIEAIGLAIILIFLILASQFESVLQPFAIMLSLPLSLVGVFVALLLTDDTLNIMSMIGIIMLLGLVTKNAILLVDHANERRAAGEDTRTALIEAGVVRLRPIIMTTLAMVFGMLPIALALGEGGGFRAPMARAVIGGLITSTMLTLVVVPVAYSYFDDFGVWVRRSRSATRPPSFLQQNGVEFMETRAHEDVAGSRQRILAAALRIYGEHGFSGSTTRRIANEARVNEVTIFRQFGSKAALMAEAVLTPPAVPPLPMLPATPGNPRVELHVWAMALLEWLRDTRTVIRRSFAETTDHPEVAGRLHSHVEAWSATLRAYIQRLEAQGRVTNSADTEIAASMFIASLLTDGLGRIELPTVFAVTPEESTSRYVGAFLRLADFQEGQTR